jgi:malate dehydrogenase (oxaloacetate-decarboxylating)(NADP+)
MDAMTSPSDAPLEPGLYLPTADQRVVMHGRSWADYEAQLALQGERSRPKLAYLDGDIELMSPSRDHEKLNSRRKEDALEYHSKGRPGKIEVVPTKPLASQRDLSLAYTPGVAEPCLEIAARPRHLVPVHRARQPRRRHLQRHRGARPRQHRPLRGKPVMEGKACLFKKFADIDVFDSRSTRKTDRLLRGRRGARAHVRRHQPRGRLGARVLRDRGAPPRERMRTSPCSTTTSTAPRSSRAPRSERSELAGKKLEDLKLVRLGRRRRAIACVEFWVTLGVRART